MDSHAKPYRIKQSFTKYLLNTVLPIIINGLVIGILVGVVVWGYNFCAEHITEFTAEIYTKVYYKMYFLPLVLVGMGALAVIMALLLKFIPELVGSGIPYTEGVMRGELKYKKIKMFFGTIAYSLLTFFSGLPLGSEGPSVQLGGLVGDIVNAGEEKIRWRAKAWRRLSITSGASAGLAVAFNAPLTGLIFALEEGHKRFSPTILLSTASAVIFSILTSRCLNYWTGLRTDFTFYIFDVGEIATLPYSSIWMLLLLGIIVGLTAALFSVFLSYTRRFYDRFKIKRIYRLLIAYVLVGLCGVLVVGIVSYTNEENSAGFLLGGGARLVKKMLSNFSIDNSFSWSTIFVLLILKMILISLSSNSGSTGGLFIPMLVVGALIGGLCSHMFINMGMDSKYAAMIVAIAMSAMMASIVRAPLTGIILVCEITGQFLNGFLQAAIVVVISYFVVELLSIKPLYDELLEGNIKAANKGKPLVHVEIEEIIDNGSFVTGRSVRDILWPAGCQVEKIVKVNREGEVVTRSDKGGERLIHAGDLYIIKCETHNLDDTLDELHALTSSTPEYEEKITHLD
ncbi:MAG TPA: hypothetical protein DCY93_01390 [Firmicutes bacterium]|nr:hypothetical protein [Bacillota bacterium]